MSYQIHKHGLCHGVNYLTGTVGIKESNSKHINYKLQALTISTLQWLSTLNDNIINSSRQRIISPNKKPSHCVTDVYRMCAGEDALCATRAFWSLTNILHFASGFERKLDKWQTRWNNDKWGDKHTVKSVNSSHAESLTARRRTWATVHYKVWSNPRFPWELQWEVEVMSTLESCHSFNSRYKVHTSVLFNWRLEKNVCCPSQRRKKWFIWLFNLYLIKFCTQTTVNGEET